MMGRVVDALSVVLLASAAVAFVLGVNALDQQKDLNSLYWLAVGGMVLKASIDVLRPHRRG